MSMEMFCVIFPGPSKQNMIVIYEKRSFLHYVGDVLYASYQKNE